MPSLRQKATIRKTPIYLRGASSPIGFVEGTIFHKTISGSKHILRRPRAIAFDLATLEDAQRAGATQVSVFDCETGKTYSAPIETVRSYGFQVTRGYGRQVAMTLGRYSINGEEPEADRRAATTNQERKALQPGLFGGAA